MGSRARDIAILAGAVYFMQGALGVASIALPLFLRNFGLSIEEIAKLSAFVAFPWVLKIAYGLLSDAVPLFSYRRKSYLILFACLGSLGWFLLSSVNHTQISTIALCLIASNLALAAIDVITDGLIVQNSVGMRSHIFQSIAWGSRSLGAILSGYAGGWLAENWSADKIFLLTSSLPLVIIFLAIRIKEEKQDRSPFHDLLEPVKKCFRLLLLPNMGPFIALILLSQSASLFGLPFFFHMKETLNFKESFLGALISIGWFGVVLASLFYARWLSMSPPKRILYLAFTMNLINILSTYLIYNQTSALILVFLGGMMACLTLLPIMSVSAMLTSRSGVEGTMFALLMSIHNIGQIGFGYLGGRLYTILGLHALIAVAAFLSFIALFIIARLHLDIKVRKPIHLLKSEHIVQPTHDTAQS